MARADLLKKLFRSYKSNDNDAFLAIAKEIIDEERKKHHVVVANDLARILQNGASVSPFERRATFESLPKDYDRGIPLIEIRHPNRYLADLVLSADQEDLIEGVLREFTHWDILESNGLRPSHKILFCGPPGCGKTVTAEAISSKLGLPLLYVRFDSVVSSLLGETASNLRKVFDYASRGSWVLLFDEFDTVGRSRDDATEHGELKRVVNAFLQMLDSFNSQSLVIAATNFEQSLDPALWRRFDEIIRFEKPTIEQIQSLLKKRLQNHPLTDVGFRKVAEKLAGMSYAEVERVSLDVLKHVALEGKREITQAEIEQAVQKQERRKQALIRSKAIGNPIVDED